ncbi:MAG: tetratricopeptide repeat protein [Planctomycetota bacterium]
MPTASELYKSAETKMFEGELEQAIELCEQAIQEDENHVLSHLTISNLATKLGDHDKAIKHGEKACEIEPDDRMNFTALSVTYQKAWAGTQNGDYIQKAEDAMARANSL